MKNNVQIASRFSLPVRVACPTGNGERTIFTEQIEDNGTRKLVATGKEDFKEFIQASKEECLIENILRKFERGDLSVLQARQGFYGDVTNMPATLQEAHNFLIDCKQAFYEMSVDDRKKFDNSFEKFVSEVSKYDTDKFLSVFGIDDGANGDNTNSDDLAPGKPIEIKEGE